MEGVKKKYVKFVEKTITDPWWCSWKAPITLLCIYKYCKSPLDVLPLEIVVKITKITYRERLELGNIEIDGFRFSSALELWVTPCGRIESPCPGCARLGQCKKHINRCHGCHKFVERLPIYHQYCSHGCYEKTLTLFGIKLPQGFAICSAVSYPKMYKK